MTHVCYFAITFSNKGLSIPHFADATAMAYLLREKGECVSTQNSGFFAVLVCFWKYTRGLTVYKPIPASV